MKTVARTLAGVHIRTGDLINIKTNINKKIAIKPIKI